MEQTEITFESIYTLLVTCLPAVCLFVTEKTSKRLNRSGLNFVWCLTGKVYEPSTLERNSWKIVIRLCLCLCIIQSEVCTTTEFLLAVCLGLGLSTLVHQGHQLLNPSADLNLSDKKGNPCSHIFNLLFSGVFRFLKTYKNSQFNTS